MFYVTNTNAYKINKSSEKYFKYTGAIGMNNENMITGPIRTDVKHKLNLK